MIETLEELLFSIRNGLGKNELAKTIEEYKELLHGVCQEVLQKGYGSKDMIMYKKIVNKIFIEEFIDTSNKMTDRAKNLKRMISSTQYYAEDNYETLIGLYFAGTVKIKRPEKKLDIKPPQQYPTKQLDTRDIQQSYISSTGDRIQPTVIKPSYEEHLAYQKEESKRREARWDNLKKRGLLPSLEDSEKYLKLANSNEVKSFADGKINEKQLIETVKERLNE